MPLLPKLRVVPAPSERLQEQPPPTLEEAFRAHAGYVARVAFRVLGRRDEVDDLVQQTFLEAASGLSQLRHPDAAKAWLATIAVRLARRMLRRRRFKQWVQLDDAPDYLDVASSHASPIDRLVLARIYQVLDQMPAKERLPWTLQIIECERLDRVAAICGCSLATAKRRIAAAQERIDEAIHGH